MFPEGRFRTEHKGKTKERRDEISHQNARIITLFVKVGGVGEIVAAVGENVRRKSGDDPPDCQFCGAVCGGKHEKHRRVGGDAAEMSEGIAA